jgi:hypothetical protein
VGGGAAQFVFIALLAIPFDVHHQAAKQVWLFKTLIKIFVEI